MKVVVLGAGYGGVRLAREMARRVRAASAERRIGITLISDTAHHVIKTELHRIAAGSIDDPGDVAVPLENLFRRLPVEVVRGRIAGLEPAKNRVDLEGETSVSYDHLVVALGSGPEFYGIPGLAEYGLTLGDLHSGLAVRRRVDDVVRAVAAGGDGMRARIVIGGGGLTGVELAGELAWVLKNRYARSDVSRRVGVTIVEAAPTLMPGLDPRLGQWAQDALLEMGVDVMTGFRILEVSEDTVKLKEESKPSKLLEQDLLVWSGGVRGNRLLEEVFPTDSKGRAHVNERLQVEAYPNVRVLGDAARVPGKDGRPVPPMAQAAMLQAVWVAGSMWEDITGGTPPASRPYTGTIKGVLASVGPEHGIGLLGRHAVRGRWVKWLKEANNVRYLASIGALGQSKRSVQRNAVFPVGS